LGAAALIATDQQTGDEIAESDKPLHASRIISYAGSSYGTGAIAAGFYLLGRATHDDRARETGLLAGEALIDSAIVATSIKAITQRTRPTGGRSRSDFFDGGSSFPSGHSIQAWTLATVIANEYHDKPAVQIAAYGIASAVSVARFTGRNHYLSDVLIGSAMGYGIGRYVYRTHHRKATGSGGSEEEESVRSFEAMAGDRAGLQSSGARVRRGDVVGFLTVRTPLACSARKKHAGSVRTELCSILFAHD
jgi:hypothetical protein